MARHRVGSDPRWDVEPFRFWKVLGRDLAGLGLLGAGSLCIALTGNALRVHPLALGYMPPEARLGVIVAKIPAALPAMPISADRRTIGLEAFQEMVLAHQGISVDARPRAFYEAGHVPGALNLPREDFEKSYATVRSTLEANHGQQTIVIYCAAADCQDSELVASALSRLGFRHLRVYTEGWEEWQRAGLPQEATAHPQ